MKGGSTRFSLWPRFWGRENWQRRRECPWFLILREHLKVLYSGPAGIRYAPSIPSVPVDTGFQGGGHADRAREGILLDRAFDRRGDHSDYRGDRDPEFHALEDERQ